MRAFYTRHLCLIEGPASYGREGGHWMYSDDQPLLHLITTTAEQSNVEPPRPAIAISLRACGLREAKADLRASGIAFVENAVPGQCWHELVLQDPAGYTIGLT